MGIVDFDDLVGYGVEGLIAATDSFDPARGVRFSTWAALHIRTTMLDALRKIDPLSQTTRHRAKVIETTRQQFAHRIGRWPTTAEVATELDLPAAQVHATMTTAQRTVVPLDETTGDRTTSVSTLAALTDEDPAVDPDAVCAVHETRRLLWEAVASLPEREAAVIRGYYQERQPMSIIAERLGVSAGRVSQLHRRALDELRAAFTAATRLAEPPRRVA